ncbi:nickel transporter [Sinomonas mesophila]|uniref:HoxN/HupN/NixA family nickel/cobalt transporter n=1 Tax=Sinomonas mesophila TaxID=1531955 RepID=UPI000985D4F8|nr:nickel transporter [Sinomonas mesophila]
MTLPAGLGALDGLSARIERAPWRRRAAGALAVVVLLHAVAGALLAAVPAGHAATVLALAGVAYLAGVKHSYDWDHLAAIDNSSRRFAARGQDPVGVGLAFSLGHSSVVVAAAALVLAGVGAVGTAFEEGSAVSAALGGVGAGVSGGFLLALGLANLAAFAAASRAARRHRRGAALTKEDLEPRGILARLLDRPLGLVRRPRDIYVVGFLFGLGFDTATTVGLLVAAAAAVLAGVPAGALLAVPFAFAGAMTLCDTANGIAMMRLYRRALAVPGRRIAFNLLITGMSAASALLVAVLTMAGLARELLGLSDPLTGFLAAVDLGDAGLLLAAAFGTAWLLAVAAERLRRPSAEAPSRT